jgi:hypothetical protein
MTTIEAPPELSQLFRTYLNTGRPPHLHRALIERLEPHGDSWMVASDWVFRLVPDGGRVGLEWERRSKVLTERETV